MDLIVCFLLGSIALSAVIIAAHVSLIYKRIDFFIDVFYDSFVLKCISFKCMEDDKK